jgi:hypothetical protein
MGSAFMMGIELVKVAIQHGWVDRGPGGCHPYVLVKPGCRLARQAEVIHEKPVSALSR